MALIKPYFQDIRGKVGGSVFSVNKGGAYMRSKVTPLNPQTQAQQNVRALLTSIAKRYSTLTAEQIAGWKSLADNTPYRDIFGDSKKLNAIAMYIKCNSMIGQTSAPLIDDAPANLDVTGIDSMTVSFLDAPSRTFEIAYSPVNAATDSLICYAAISVPTSKTFVKNLYRVCAIADGLQASPWTITSPPELGPFVDGTKICVRVVRVNKLNGAVTLAREDSTMIV